MSRDGAGCMGCAGVGLVAPAIALSARRAALRSFRLYLKLSFAIAVRIGPRPAPSGFDPCPPSRAKLVVLPPLKPTIPFRYMLAMG